MTDKIKLTPCKGIGCYYTDEQKKGWSTFSYYGPDKPYTCSRCKRKIARGYDDGKVGGTERVRYACVDCVEIAG